MLPKSVVNRRLKIKINRSICFSFFFFFFSLRIFNELSNTLNDDEYVIVKLLRTSVLGRFHRVGVRRE